MTTQSLSNPTIEVNDQVIAIIANSCSYKKGYGDRSIKSQSAGGNAIETVVTIDASTKKSMVKFKLLPTKENFELSDAWTTNISGNTIRLSEGSLTESFRGMIVTSEPEKTVGVDGELELVFEGSPVL